jgi:hypothetical protein
MKKSKYCFHVTVEHNMGDRRDVHGILVGKSEERRPFRRPRRR